MKTASHFYRASGFAAAALLLLSGQSLHAEDPLAVKTGVERSSLGLRSAFAKPGEWKNLYIQSIKPVDDKNTSDVYITISAEPGQNASKNAEFAGMIAATFVNECGYHSVSLHVDRNDLPDDLINNAAFDDIEISSAFYTPESNDQMYYIFAVENLPTFEQIGMNIQYDTFWTKYSDGKHSDHDAESLAQNDMKSHYKLKNDFKKFKPIERKFENESRRFFKEGDYKLRYFILQACYNALALGNSIRFETDPQ